MKKTTLFLSILLTCISIQAQYIIENPKTGLSTARNLKITKIATTDTSTVLSFHFKSRPGTWIWIPKMLFIRPLNSPDKIFVKSAIGINKIVFSSEQPYTAPVFNLDSATYSGYIYGYSERLGAKTLSAHIDNILTGSQETKTIEISKNGFFSVKLPLYYPQSVYIRSEVVNSTVFLEPGTELFQIINPGENRYFNAFVGETAITNIGLQRIGHHVSFDHQYVIDNILNFTPVEYMQYCINMLKKDQAHLESLGKTETISPKVIEMSLLDLIYRFYPEFFQYKFYYERAYRKENNLPKGKYNLTLDAESTPDELYKLLKIQVINNPIGVICPAYSRFINWFKFSDVLRKNTTKQITVSEIVRELNSTGTKLNKSELELVRKVKEIEVFSDSAGYSAYKKEYGIIKSNLVNNYGRMLTNFWDGNYKSAKEISDYLTENATLRDTADIKIFQILIDNEDVEIANRVESFYIKNRKLINDFINKYKEIADQIALEYEQEKRLENINNKFGYNTGISIDIMNAQDYLSRINDKFSPLNDEEITRAQKSISDTFIRNYIPICNEHITQVIEKNKQAADYALNELSPTVGDHIFDTIIANYKGKVVYVDFWATWCGPCRSAMEQMKPLKEELIDSNIVFLYITNHTSPAGTWSNMIPNVKGEHYRVSSDQWNYLSEMFNISGIPHFVLVGKNGEIINPKMHRMNNEKLKQLLMEHARDAE